MTQPQVERDDEPEIGLSEHDQAKLDEIKREHPKVLWLEHPTLMVFKKAPPVVWADYQEAITKEKGTHTNAFRRLCYACLVYPDAKTVEGIFRDYPALPTKLANAITEISGQGDEFEVKKH